MTPSPSLEDRVKKAAETYSSGSLEDRVKKAVGGSSGEPLKQKPGILKKAAQFGGDVLAGIGAEAIGTGIGALKFADKLTGVPTPEKGNPLYSPGAKALSTPPATAGGTTGSMIERAGELLAPGALEEKIVAAVPKVTGSGLSLISKMAASMVNSVPRAATAAATTGALAGLHGENAKTAAETTGGLTLFGGVMAPVIAKLGRSIQMSSIRPRALDKVDGFKWSTVDKLKLKGNLEQSYAQVEAKLAQLRNERNALIAPGSANVDVDKLFQEALDEVTKDAQQLKLADKGIAAINAVKRIWKDTADSAGVKIGQLKKDVREVENLKEQFGTQGAWAYGSKDPAAQMEEKVYNALYSKVRQGIEDALGPAGQKVKDLNRQMQELIPVKHAMIARIPVEERNRIFSLADLAAMLPAVATGDPKKLGLLALQLAQKSMRVGNLLNRAGSGAIAKPVAKVAGATLGSNALPPP